jgi:peptidoglycan/LPS O-acetylase OafA/YrhL
MLGSLRFPRLRSAPNAEQPTGNLDLRGRLPAIDALRAIAPLLLFIVHFNRIDARDVTTPLERVYFLVVQLGVAGMEIFFVISGFLITGILLDSKGGPGYFRIFYLRRVLRILPLYYGFLFAWLVLLPILMRSETGTLLASTHSPLWLWAHLTNVVETLGGRGAVATPLRHLWSLAVEEQFYLLWPLVVFVCDRSRLLRVCLALIIVAPVFRVALLLAGSPLGAYNLTPGRAEALAMGAILAILAREPGGLRHLTRWAWPVGGAAFAVLLAGYLLGPVAVRSPFFYSAGLTASAYLAGSLLILALNRDLGPVGNRLLSLPPLTSLGKYCYGLYVLHVPLQELLNHFGFKIGVFAWSPFGTRLATQMLYTLLLTFLSICLAIIVWHIYEKQFLKLGVHFRYGHRADPLQDQGAPGQAIGPTRGTVRNYARRIVGASQAALSANLTRAAAIWREKGPALIKDV